MRGRVWTVVTALSIAGLPADAWAQDRPWEWGSHHMWGMWGVWGLGMVLTMVTFWVVAIVALVAIVRWLAGPTRTPVTDPALDILRQRYARGEINKEEFEAKKRDLATRP
jgi:putative membrane protein